MLIEGNGTVWIVHFWW